MKTASPALIGNRLYSIRAQHVLTRLMYLGQNLEVGSAVWSKAVADWYLANSDLHKEGTTKLCQILDEATAKASSLHRNHISHRDVAAYYHQRGGEKKQNGKRKSSVAAHAYDESRYFSKMLLSLSLYSHSHSLSL